ncbi:Lysosome membrane protein 2 [Echinococcus granulosus]|uniref:Scavenger receptor class B member 1 n=1 Tax=Echinococcus granulosus TaxID=6210 RepID=A0A068WLS4_ECHGR|nr:Lysosome membrane protein 2 [Echinococcus granulosus]CDS18581.1 CD36 class B scavenger receptor [Echinococcus granulosus]
MFFFGRRTHKQVPTPRTHQVMKYHRRSRLPILITSTALVFCFLISIASLALLLLFDNIVEWKISESVKLQNESAVLNSWKSQNVVSKFSVFFYNLTNPTEMLAGEKPVLQAIGPYVYWQENEKVNISWTEVDGVPAISYFKRSTYKYDAKLSVGDPKNDAITSANLPILAISAASNAGRGPSLSTIEMVKFWTSPQIFTTQTVHGFLWGYFDTMLSLCKIFYPETCQTDHVGLLLNTNNTLKGPYIIDAGIKNSSNVGKFLSIKGNRKLNIWSTKRANEIRGTDGTRLAKGIQVGDLREIFVALLCQPIKITAKDFTHPSAFQDLKVMEMDLDSSKCLPGEVYCPNKASGPECPPRGLFDISQCSVRGDVAPPIFASMPHFLNSLENITTPFRGLRSADPRRDNFKLLVEPRTGIVVEAHIRLQVNAHIERSAHMADLYKNISDPMYLPMAWFENEIEGGPEALKLLYSAVYVQPDHIRLAIYVSFILAVTLFGIFSIVNVILMLVRNSKCICSVFRLRKQNPSVRHLLLDAPADSASDLFLKNNEDTVRSTVSPWNNLIRA